MRKRRIDRAKVKKLYDEGKGPTEIGEELGCAKSTISVILKGFNLIIAKQATVEAAKNHIAGQLDVKEESVELLNLVKEKLKWIDDNLPNNLKTAIKSEKLKMLSEFIARATRLLETIGKIEHDLFKGVQMELYNRVTWMAINEVCDSEQQKRISKIIDSTANAGRVSLND